MTAILNAVLPIFALILAGYVCAKRGILGPETTDSLNNFVVKLSLPTLLFQAMAQITWKEIDHPGFIIAFGVGLVGTFLVSLLVNRQSRQRLADASIESLAASYPNTGFMGIPLCLATFGSASLPPAIISTLMTACVIFAISIILIEIDLQQEKHLGLTLQKVAVSLIRNPLIVAPALGVIFATTGLALPAPVLRFTTLLGAAASPCALVTIGLFLAQQNTVQESKLVWRIVGLKLFLQPAITAFLAFKVFAMPAIWSESALLLSALPIGTGPFMLAKLYNREASVTSRAILFSTIVSVVTISLIVAWFERATLP